MPSTTHKRPFQDITDRFIPPRPKRKPKTPGGTLGEKLRLRVINTTAKTFPSSLPPSSPPLYQSSSSLGLPLLSSEDEVAQQVHEDAAPFGQEDFGSMLPSDEEGDSDAENRAPANQSDPFGFFAVERRLKAEREVQPMASRPSRYTDDKERDDGLVMPSTPHKPTLGKRRLSDVFSPANTSLASSPSPVKAVGPRDLGMDTSRELLPALADDEDAPPKGKKLRQSSEASLPPRRSTRAQSKAVAEKEAPKPKKRVRKAPTKTTTKTKGKGKKKAVEDNDPDDDQHERFEAERQARLDYFRKLDEYSFEKENVYVV
ncbi:hypothetical protein B0H19DRAFT_17541 [Mycena capillaripes]|nr:hypothetical protein B0H19DRAFT_17541 [Mycena capillaripes]